VHLAEPPALGLPVEGAVGGPSFPRHPGLCPRAAPARKMLEPRLDGGLSRPVLFLRGSGQSFSFCISGSGGV
jgi:hypothetical protein